MGLLTDKRDLLINSLIPFVYLAHNNMKTLVTPLELSNFMFGNSINSIIKFNKFYFQSMGLYFPYIFLAMWHAHLPCDSFSADTRVLSFVLSVTSTRMYLRQQEILRDLNILFSLKAHRINDIVFKKLSPFYFFTCRHTISINMPNKSYNIGYLIKDYIFVTNKY